MERLHMESVEMYGGTVRAVRGPSLGAVEG